jgi:hypothetical protein
MRGWTHWRIWGLIEKIKVAILREDQGRGTQFSLQTPERGVLPVGAEICSEGRTGESLKGNQQAQNSACSDSQRSAYSWKTKLQEEEMSQMLGIWRKKIQHCFNDDPIMVSDFYLPCRFAIEWRGGVQPRTLEGMFANT